MASSVLVTMSSFYLVRAEICSYCCYVVRSLYKYFIILDPVLQQLWSRRDCTSLVQIHHGIVGIIRHEVPSFPNSRHSGQVNSAGHESRSGCLSAHESPFCLHSFSFCQVADCVLLNNPADFSILPSLYKRDIWEISLFKLEEEMLHPERGNRRKILCQK